MKTLVNSLLLLIFPFSLLFGQESLPSLSDPIFNGQVPNSLDEGWAGYDPTSETLNVEVLHSWTENQTLPDASTINVTIQVIRFDVGIFKGETTKMAGLYAFPTGQSNLPAILECHGGGQYSNVQHVINNAANGYACFSMNWGGSDIPLGLEGTWTGLNTEWKGVVANQTTTNDHWDGNSSLQPTQYTIDDVVSPRNNNWFIVTLAARRSITLLANQPEVDDTNIGMYGFSMGGALTFSTASIDKRIKAAVSMAAAKVIPGSNSTSMEGYDMWMNCISAYAYAKELSCPMIFHNASNDFHGIIDDVEQLVDSLDIITPTEYRYTREVNKNHSNNSENDVNYILWFDQHLKNSFNMPLTPSVNSSINGTTPSYQVTVDNSSSIKNVSIWYTTEDKSNPISPTNRVWVEASSSAISNQYTATLPTIDTSLQTMRIFTNVEYNLSTSRKSGWGYTMNFHSISSEMTILGATSTSEDRYTLSLTAQNGSITVSPEQSDYAYGDIVTLTAVPDANYEFSNWAQNVSGTDNPITLLIDGNKGVEAIFNRINNQVTGDTIYLSDINWVSQTNGVFDVNRDLNFNGNPITINGVSYDKGLGTHAVSKVVYDLNQEYKTFRSDIGIDDECNGNVVFQVSLDDVVIYTSPLVTSASSTISLDLDISNGNTLTLDVFDGGDGIGCDHANWADALIIKDGTVTSSDVVIAQDNIQLFPVPFNESVAISNPSKNDVTIKVIDLNGNELYYHLLKGESEIRIGNEFSPGVYMINALSNNKIESFRIIKSR